MKWKHETVSVPGYEKVVYAEESSSGLKAIIAVHNTALGPACGGIRMLPYANREEAMFDVLRLSRGMSYKSALADIGFGGGKSVVIGDPTKKTKELFNAFGEFVGTFDGMYIAAKDMNIANADLAAAKEKTKYVLGVEGEKGSSGDPSPVTALGVYRAMEATWENVSGNRSLKGLKVALQGVGHVGHPLAKYLHEAGAELIVTDIDAKALERAKKDFGAKVVGLEEIYDVACDIFSPGARGGVLNPQTIARLKCKAICGCANNQLLTEEDGVTLQKKGILYAPDFAVNSGGIINIFVEYEGYDQKKALAKADHIYVTMKEVFDRSKKTGKPPFVIADQLAEERMNAGR